MPTDYVNDNKPQDSTLGLKNHPNQYARIDLTRFVTWGCFGYSNLGIEGKERNAFLEQKFKVGVGNVNKAIYCFVWQRARWG